MLAPTRLQVRPTLAARRIFLSRKIDSGRHFLAADPRQHVDEAGLQLIDVADLAAGQAATIAGQPIDIAGTVAVEAKHAAIDGGAAAAWRKNPPRDQ